SQSQCLFCIKLSLCRCVSLFLDVFLSLSGCVSLSLCPPSLSLPTESDLLIFCFSCRLLPCSCSFNFTLSPYLSSGVCLYLFLSHYLLSISLSFCLSSSLHFPISPLRV